MPKWVPDVIFAIIDLVLTVFAILAFEWSSRGRNPVDHQED